MSKFAYVTSRALSVCGLLLLAATLPLRAGVILDLTFDDPLSMMKDPGVSKVTSEFARSTASVASGVGGRALPQIPEAPQEGTSDPSVLKIQTVSDPPLGPSPFVRLFLDPKAGAKSISLGLLPTDPSSSLAALVTYDKGMAFFDGGYDFVFRTDKDWSGTPPKLVVQSKAGPLGLAVEIDPKPDRGMLVRLSTAKPALDLDGDNTPEKMVAVTRLVNDVPFEPGQIYHAAVTLQTSPEGLVTIRLFLQKGLGEIRTDNPAALNASLEGFRVLAADDSGERADKVVFVLGKRDFAQTLDLANFRIFRPAPEVFPGLDAPSGKPPQKR